MTRWVTITGVLCAALAAVCWAVGVTELQPLTEPLGPWSERLAGNNTYWARDLRFMALVGVLAGLVLATGGDRRAATWVVPAGVLWIAADVWLDRVDAGGTPVTVALAGAGVGVALATVAAVRRWPARPSRTALIVVAAVAAATVPVAAGIESPTDREPELTPAALAVAALLAVVALGCALAAVPSTGRRRWTVAGPVAVLVAAGIVLVRLQPPGARITAMALLATVLLAGVAALADPAAGRPDPVRLGLVALGAAVGYPSLLVLLAIGMMWWPGAAALTRAAGNPAVNSADSDLLLSLIGVLVGLVSGAILARMLDRPLTWVRRGTVRDATR